MTSRVPPPGGGPHRSDADGGGIERHTPAGRSLVLVAGLPGAGKTTFLGRLVNGGGVAVVDSQAQRDALSWALPAQLPYTCYRPLVHVLHRLAIVCAAVVGPAVVAVHLPATGAPLRVVVALLAAITGRVAHLIWLEIDPAVARARQVERGRIVASGCFAGHARRASATSAALRAGRLPWGWDTVTVLDQARAEDDPGVVLARVVRHRGHETGPGGRG